MQVHVGAKGDESDQRVVGHEVERLLQRILQLIQVLVLDAGVDDEEEVNKKMEGMTDEEKEAFRENFKKERA